ncbi:MAG: O-methyltransferase [Bacteroidia bacterium]
MKLGSTLSFVYRFCSYYLKATNRHGLQAPFAFQLNEFVFKQDRHYDVLRPIEKLRRKLKKDRRRIKVLDFGAGFGGKVFKEKSIAYIARNSAKPPRYARMLFRLVNYLKPLTIVELGTSLGISALYQAAGNSSAKIFTLEGCPETARVAQENFERFPFYKIESVVGAFENTLPALLEKVEEIDFLFIDGHHQLKPTLQYIEMCLPKLSKAACIVVDDINWSDEMREAWQQLLADKRFTLSFDIFMMGILFVSKDLSKENFVLRY